MTEMYFCLLRMGISEESIRKLCSLPYAIWFFWNLSRIFNGMPHCSIIPLIRARENGSAMACVNLWLKTLRLSLSCRHPHPFLHPSLSLSTHPLHPLLFLAVPFSSFGFFHSGYPSLSIFTCSFFSIHSSLFISHSTTLAYMCFLVVLFPAKLLCAHCDRLSAPLDERIWIHFYLVWSVSASCCPFLIKQDKPRLH